MKKWSVRVRANKEKHHDARTHTHTHTYFIFWMVQHVEIRMLQCICDSDPLLGIEHQHAFHEVDAFVCALRHTQCNNKSVCDVRAPFRVYTTRPEFSFSKTVCGRNSRPSASEKCEILVSNRHLVARCGSQKDRNGSFIHTHTHTHTHTHMSTQTTLDYARTYTHRERKRGEARTRTHTYMVRWLQETS